MEAIEELAQLSDSMRQASALLADEDVDETTSSSSSSKRSSTFLNVVGIGNTGAGKSAVLNSLIGHPALPTGEGGATRAPICVDLTRDSSLSSKSIVLQIDSKSQAVSASALRHSLQDRLSKATGKSRDEIYLKLRTSTARRAGEKDEVAPRDVVDSLLQLAEDHAGGLEVKLTRDCIKGLVQDLIVGGTDTAVGVIEWAIQEVMRHPRVAEKAKEELDRVIGRNRWAKESDFPQLPYINAIIVETMRLHSVSPLLPPHYAIDDCKVAGYDIAKGTVVFINTYSLGRDPNSWNAPEEFLPERFMGNEVDLIGGNFALLPFGSGRRSCPGYKLGLKNLVTAVANLLHGFELKLVEGMRPQDICMDEVYGLIQYPKHPLPIVMEPTLPPHLY